MRLTRFSKTQITSGPGALAQVLAQLHSYSTSKWDQGTYFKAFLLVLLLWKKWWVWRGRITGIHRKENPTDLFQGYHNGVKIASNLRTAVSLTITCPVCHLYLKTVSRGILLECHALLQLKQCRHTCVRYLACPLQNTSDTQNPILQPNMHSYFPHLT